MQLVVGRIGRPHGLHGDVIVEVRTDEPGQRFAAGSVLATEPAARGPLTVASARWHSGRLLVSFAGFHDRSAAQGLSGVLLVLDSAQLPAPPDPDEFYDHQLIGLEVVTTAGDMVGVVGDVLHHGQDLLVVKSGVTKDGIAKGGVAKGGVARGGAAAGASERSGAEILVPFVAALVPEVDVAAGRIVIDPPPGLLDPGAGG
jgi:16S rRNA processing protein RimM